MVGGMAGTSGSRVAVARRSSIRPANPPRRLTDPIRGDGSPKREGPCGRAHRRWQKPPTKSSLYHRKPLRSQIALSSSWV
jgi:hypothetical protein